jgi:signal transduction histidine kinase
MRERGRLEREIIDLSENEQRRLGQELHDVVCQELASVSIAAHMLSRELSTSDQKETAHAREVATMADHALETTRRIARGFFTTGFDSAGLAEALGEIARHTEEKTGISCVVHWPEDLAITDENTVIHLFRIAQQAIQNAVKHASATHIKVSLERKAQSLHLMIEDDGRGLPSPTDKEKGLGLRIMAYRAGLLGGEFKTEAAPKGGTRIVCQIPVRDRNGPSDRTAP